MIGDIRLYPVDFDKNSNEIVPTTIGDVRCDKYNSKRLSYSRTSTRNVYRTSSGRYWAHVEVDGLGHYIAILSKSDADRLIAYNKKTNGTTGFIKA